MGLFYGVIDVVNGNHPRAEKPVRVRLTEVVQPVVVRSGERGGKARVALRVGEDAEGTRREKNGDVDPLDIHRLQMNLGRPASFGMISIDPLVLVEVSPSVGCPCSPVDVGFDLRKDQPK